MQLQKTTGAAVIHWFFKLLELLVVVCMVAMREGGHLGVDTLVKHLPVAGKKVCLFLSESLCWTARPACTSTRSLKTPAW